MIQDELRKDVQITYDQLLLGHLRGMSIMINTIPTLYSGSNMVQYGTNDKESALSWGVVFLTSILPENLQDKRFIKETKELANDVDDRKKKINVRYWMKVLNVTINLLSRKGILFGENTSGIVGVDINDKE